MASTRIVLGAWGSEHIVVSRYLGIDDDDPDRMAIELEWAVDGGTYVAVRLEANAGELYRMAETIKRLTDI